MTRSADVCLIVEGGYPYALGGVSSWTDALIRSSPRLTFQLIAISIAAQDRVPIFPPPENLVAVSDLLLDKCPLGRPARRKDATTIDHAVKLMHAVLTTGEAAPLFELCDLVRHTGLGQSALLDSRQGWEAMERVYCKVLPNGPLLDFFWSWRFLARSLLAVITHPAPEAVVIHAVSTGYAGLVGACAQYFSGNSYAVTEHGIYTNERRIELSVSDWIYKSGANGYDTSGQFPELQDFWLTSFNCFSRISYAVADVVTTQYRANQEYQRLDGASEDKLRIIPNGIDIECFSAPPVRLAERRPTVLMIARIVPIKDIRTFITAIALLKDMIPNVSAIIVGPDGEDHAYAEGCRALAKQLGLDGVLNFAGRVPEVKPYLATADVIALTSISEAQPIALLEAAATGLPAVTTDVGCCREIIEGFEGDSVRGHGGIVVEPCNPTATATALATILGDRNLRDRMGHVMRRRIPNLYHKERISRLYEGLYDELANRSKSRIPKSQAAKSAEVVMN